MCPKYFMKHLNQQHLDTFWLSPAARSLSNTSLRCLIKRLPKDDNVIPSNAAIVDPIGACPSDIEKWPAHWSYKAACPWELLSCGLTFMGLNPLWQPYKCKKAMDKVSPRLMQQQTCEELNLKKDGECLQYEVDIWRLSESSHSALGSFYLELYYDGLTWWPQGLEETPDFQSEPWSWLLLDCRVWAISHNLALTDWF